MKSKHSAETTTFSNKKELIEGSHILYIYQQPEKYLENAVSFFMAGLSFQHQLVCIDSRQSCLLLQEQLQQKGVTEEELGQMIFIDEDELATKIQASDLNQALQFFQSMLKPFQTEKKAVRVWSRVGQTLNKKIGKASLAVYEEATDEIAQIDKIVFICCYDGYSISASDVIDLMKTHSSVMTDEKLARSIYYRHYKQAPSFFLEEQLEEKVSRYSNLIEEMPDAVFIDSNSRIVYGNRAAADLLECEPAEFLHHSLWDLVCPEYHQTMKERTQLLQDGGKLPLAEIKMKTMQGNVVDVEVVSFPFLFNGGESTTISIVRSIKERKEHQQLTIKAEKLSLAGQLAASIAHEVRNPLTSIKGFLKLAREDTMNDEYYAIIEEEIDRIETIASELLVLGRPMSMEMKIHDAGKLLRDVCVLLQPQAVMKKIAIDATNVQTGCPVCCNAGQIKQVFINIIKNAIEAMDNGGVIRVSSNTIGGLVVIVIEDEGKGMPDSMLDKLGEPFYSTKTDGTGLGLMVCFNIIEQYKGQIHVRSQVGKGTSFTISLPATHF